MQEPRLDRDDEARLQRETATGAAVVGDVRIAVHRATDTVTTELRVDRETVRSPDRTDGRRDVADLVAGTRHRDRRVERFLGLRDEPDVLVAGRADDDADRRVAHPAVDRDREVEADQVAVLELCSRAADRAARRR